LVVTVPPSAIDGPIILFGWFVVLPPSEGVEAAKAMRSTKDHSMAMRVVSLKPLHLSPTQLNHPT
jgi:hypothetical protein